MDTAMNKHNQLPYTVTITQNPDFQEIPQQKKSRIWINILLFILTVFTTTLAGAVMNPTDKLDIAWFLSGLRFSVPLLFILGIHEMGHYTASRIHKIRATLPYFIPAPTLIGTFGAFIKIKEHIVDRRALMDIGAAGPLAGFIVAIPILIWGVKTSSLVEVKETIEAFRLGESLILSGVVRLLWEEIPKGFELYLSPQAFAAWLGLFVTSLNLLPIGQLDGGHIAYSLWGRKASTISKIVFVLLLPLAFFWMGWLFWAFFLLIITGLKHPPLVDPSIPLGRERRLTGYICIVVFIFTFTPIPFSFG